MIIGIGIDIIEVDRVRTNVAKNNGFTEKVFSEAEISFCEMQHDKAQHYAARFAAKEAFLKATGKGLLLGLELHDIEIGADALGKPVLKLKGDFAQYAGTQGWTNIHVSLTHVQAMACAVVIIEQ